MGCTSSGGASTPQGGTVLPCNDKTEQGSKPVITSPKQIEPSSDEAAESTYSFHEQYQLQNKLGKGAFAQVYAVKQAPGLEQLSIEQNLCVKVTDLRMRRDGQPRPEVDEKAQRQVKKEVMLLRKLGSKDSIIHVLDSFFEDSLSYIVMERCDLTLLAAMDRLPELTERTMVDFFSQFLEGMDAIHKVNIVHRDVKPDNFLCKNAAAPGTLPIVKVCDFGMAEVLLDGRALRGVYGTAPFMSPEMLGSSGYGTKTDVWSIFVMCYVFLIGKFPYQPVEANAKSMKAAIVAGVPEPRFQPSSTLPSISQQSDSFLRLMFQRDVAKRLGARETLEAMQQGYSGEQWAAKSLRPMLNSAKRLGAFDTRRVKENENDVDSSLQFLQTKFHGRAEKPPSKPA